LNLAAAYHRGVASRISAGILLYRRVPGGGLAQRGELEVLLGHPGGPFHAGRDLGDWSIPKGEVEPGEDLYEVARREFEEETGHAPPDAAAIALGSIVQKGGKLVHAWALEGDLDPATAVSNTFSMAWPPGSETLAAFPEIDRVAWFAPEEARRRVKEAQAPFVDRLEEALGRR
jgi:predicted NUDIX family NTP pyrophosphohydrolase